MAEELTPISPEIEAASLTPEGRGRNWLAHKEEILRQTIGPIDDAALVELQKYLSNL